MRWSIRGIYIISVLCGAVSFWAAKNFTTHFFTANVFQFHFDGSFSESQKTRIKDFFIHGQSFFTKPLSELSRLARKKFPSVDRFNISQNASGIRFVQIKSVDPLWIINRDLVLAHNRSLFERSIFDSSVLKELKDIAFYSIDSKKQNSFFKSDETELISFLPKPFFEAVKKIPLSLFDKFSVSCQSSAKWWLRDKNQKNFFILFNGDAVPNNQMLIACSEVKRTLESRNQFTKRRGLCWVADVRFNNQIIVFRKVGGR